MRVKRRGYALGRLNLDFPVWQLGLIMTTGVVLFGKRAVRRCEVTR